jgi:GT2 family glycosyltransferase
MVHLGEEHVPLRDSEPEQVPGFTIAVTTCGRPDALDHCLAGILAGTARPGELIVVDQEPSERSRAVCERHGAVHLAQARLGLSAARNLALAHATGAVLATTDDDCIPDPGWLAALADALTRAPAVVGVTGPIAPNGTRPPGMYSVSGRESLEPRDYSGRMPPWRVGSGGNFAAPVDVLRALGGWDERLGAGSAGRAAEDSELFYRLLVSGATLRYEPRALVRHEWQTWEHRLATRSSYAFGVGALCGILLRERDAFATVLLTSYVRMHLDALPSALARRRRRTLQQHTRALASLPRGVVYGLTRRPRARAPVAVATR